MIKGIDTLISEATETQVVIAKDSLSCVARGCGAVLTNPSLLRKINVTSGLN